VNQQCCLLFCSNREPAAVKVIKNIDKYREAAKLEINVLLKIKEKDPKGDKYVAYRIVRRILLLIMIYQYFSRLASLLTIHITRCISDTASSPVDLSYLINQSINQSINLFAKTWENNTCNGTKRAGLQEQ